MLDPQQEKLKTLLKKLNKSFWIDMHTVGVENSCGLQEGPYGRPGTWPVGMVGGWLLEELIRKAELLLDGEIKEDSNVQDKK